MSFHSRPGAGTQTGRVWEIADELSRQKGERARRSEVIRRFTDEGGNARTANTQYQYWKHAFETRKARGEAPLPAQGKRFAPCNVGEQWLNVAPDGRLLIPATMRQAMLLGGDGKVTARVVDGELRVIAPFAAIRQIQQIAQKYVKPGESVVDEFLAERRALWGEE